ncbi:MAG TPA: GrpB family protein [Mucilaginibacter sp.]|jgi:GrpB-like predicted nucleotidyltransferase (UPF0157 family)|nr:GrpB family protein [Mucilaginibacter sp.]
MKDKSLKDLTKQEIGYLFPVEISPYNNDWPQLYEMEKKLIADTLEEGMTSRIEHFGSTSVPGLSSKDTIDILMEVEFEEDKNQRLIEFMKRLSYDFNWQNEGNHSHMIFLKGYDLSGQKQQTFHIHAGPKDHPIWDRLYFRDYLIKHPEIAMEYETLKKKLAEKYKHDRVAYRVAKTEFVKEITDKAKNYF